MYIHIRLHRYVSMYVCTNHVQAKVHTFWPRLRFLPFLSFPWRFALLLLLGCCCHTRRDDLRHNHRTMLKCNNNNNTDARQRKAFNNRLCWSQWWARVVSEDTNTLKIIVMSALDLCVCLHLQLSTGFKFLTQWKVRQMVVVMLKAKALNCNNLNLNKKTVTYYEILLLLLQPCKPPQ